MTNQPARPLDSSPERPRLTAVKWSVPSCEPDTSEVDESWFEDAPRHSFISYKGAHPFGSAPAASSSRAIAPMPLAYDVWESPHALVVLVDLPGVESDQVALSLGSQALHLDVMSAASAEPRLGVPAGHYEVRLEAALGLGPDAIDAALCNGLLRIRIGKERSGARRVAIVTNDDAD